MLAFKKFHPLTLLLLLAFSQFGAAQTEAPATIPASLTGTYNLTYSQSSAGGPFTNGEAVTLVVKADNTLCVKGATFSNPVLRNGNAHEAIWTASSLNVEFALSSLVNGFNEVNVGGLGGSPFFGQLQGSKASANTTCASQAVVTSTMTSVFELAESKLSEFFPPGAVTLFLENYVYRFYPSTGIYLAFADGNVFLLGGAFGDAVVEAGSLSSVLNALEVYEPVVSGGGTGNLDLWTLTISGSFDTAFIQNLAFSGITLTDIPAPDLNDLDEINDEIVKSLEGVASSIGNVSITVVNNTSSRRTFDVSMTATVTGAGTVTYNLRYDYTK